MTTKTEQEKLKFPDAARKLGNKIEAGYDDAEKKADEIIGKGEVALANAKKSKWTAIWLAGATAVSAIAAFFILK